MEVEGNLQVDHLSFVHPSAQPVPSPLNPPSNLQAVFSTRDKGNDFSSIKFEKSMLGETQQSKRFYLTLKSLSIL